MHNQQKYTSNITNTTKHIKNRKKQTVQQNNSKQQYSHTYNIPKNDSLCGGH